MRARGPYDTVFTGAPWRAGLPPGVYEDRPRASAPQTVRMDVTAFLGLAERGPLAVPVPVASTGAFARIFGASSRERLLGPAVRLFFDNGGRRAVILRVADAAAASTARLDLPQLRIAGAPLRLAARSPGAWGNRMVVEGRFRRRFLNLTRSVAHLPFEAQAAVPLAPGSLVRFRAVAGASRPILRVTEAQPESGGVRLRFSAVLPAAIRFGAPGAETLAGEEITLDLDVSVDAGTPHGYVETWRDLGLSPSHPDFLIRRLGARALSETYAEPEDYDPARPDHVDFDAVTRQAAALDADPGRAGSELLRPEAADWSAEILPAATVLDAGGTFRIDALDIAPGAEGGDGAATTERAHFLAAPTNGAFARQPAPLEAIARYDAAHATEPISFVTGPDLAHPRQGALPPAPDDPTDDSLRFRLCAEPRPVRIVARFDPPYPRLALDHDRPGLAAAQRALVDWCERRDDRIALLDLPPGLAPGAVEAWRREVASDRAALYAPYLETGPTAEALTLPPAAAAAGLAARREAERGVQHAPANLRVSGVLGLARDPNLPDPGFLHEARIDAVRLTETGLTLLGARTTSLDPDWTHLSVRRLVDYLRRQLALDLAWAVFEPNGPPLWRRIRTAVERRLAALFDADAFAGAAPEDAYFVRCDRRSMSQGDLDAGRLVCLVGVAPAVPMEFLVFRLTRLGEAGFAVEDAA